MTPVIAVRGLRFQYEDGAQALNGVDFDLYSGEVVALLGGNGSGKTTFALHLNGLLHGQGSVRVCGMEVAAPNLAAVRAKIGMVFQDADEQLFMPTVLEDVAFGPRNLGCSEPEALARARTALDQVGMGQAAAKAPYHLSAGEKRRAALAGVLAMNPEILVLDEPTTYLDPPAQRNLVQLLAGLTQAKLIITHDVAFARALATRAVFFKEGQIAGQGGVDQVIEAFNWRPDLQQPVLRHPAGSR